MSIPAGTTITSAGTVVGQVTLNAEKNYVVSAGVTALTSGTDSLQCQLSSSLSTTWDDMGEADLTTRATVPLEHAYPELGTPGSYTVSVACRSNSANFVVDTGHLYAWQLGSVATPVSPVIMSAPAAMRWAPMQ